MVVEGGPGVDEEPKFLPEPPDVLEPLPPFVPPPVNVPLPVSPPPVIPPVDPPAVIPPVNPPPANPAPANPVPNVAPVPVNIEQRTVPAAPMPPAPRAPIQTTPEPPAATGDPALASRVSFTSSMDPGTEAVTMILLLTVVGVWIYANRIVTQWSLLKRADQGANA
jgi:hypothetical protein